MNLKIAANRRIYYPLRICGLLLVVAGAATAAEPPRQLLVWADRQAHGHTIPGEVLPADGGEPARLKLVHSEPTPRQFTLAEFVPPATSEPSYVIRGRVRYSHVTKPGYFELLNHFPGQGAFFTRTLDHRGPLGRIEGTSDWRDFELPFFKGPIPGPEKLVVNLHLEGSGTIEITDLEWSAPANVVLVSGAWWSDAMGGMIGGVGGAFLGVFLGGCLVPLMNRGRARAFVQFSLLGTSVVCTLILGVGLVAVARHQPYSVYYPLLLLGGIGLGVSVMHLRTARRKYSEIELQQIAALDAV